MQDTIKGGRWYAMAGESGLLMCTWPKGGADKARGTGRVFDVGVGYFNECMNGFEYQVASHMIWEGRPGDNLVQKGMAITRAIHDRYSALKRNPYNEIECSDHYSRSMASYGIFLAACGYEYHGPSGYLAFAPRISPEDFKAPFTSAQGWGSFSQMIKDDKQFEIIEIKWGTLTLKKMAFELPSDRAIRSVKVTGAVVKFAFKQEQKRLSITLDEHFTLSSGQTLQVVVSL
jgi:hypothetical protein